MMKRTTMLSCVVVLSAALASCGGNDASDEGATPSSTTAEKSAPSTTTAEESQNVEVRAVDYAFEGFPKTLPVGSRLTLVNNSSEELHELVAIKLPPTETRPAADLVKLPPEEQSALSQGPPAMVLIAPPGGSPQISAVGDGTLAEKGRYLVICSIPTGADPEEYLAAAAKSQGGPPDVEGGPPHLVHGMFAEVSVE
jgi:hypothetical protein